MQINDLAVGGATLVAFVFGSVWYTVWSKQRASLSPAASAQTRPPLWMMAVEILRTLILSLVLAALASRLRITGWTGAVPFAAVLWIALPVVLLSGSVLYEAVPWRLATLHAADWLGKLLIITIIVSVWR